MSWKPQPLSKQNCSKNHIKQVCGSFMKRKPQGTMRELMSHAEILFPAIL